MRMTNLHDVHTAGSRRVLGGFSSILGDSRRDRGGSWQVCCKLLAASRLLWLWRVLGEFLSSSCRVLCEFWSRSGLLTPKLGSKSLQNEARWLPRASKIDKKSCFFSARVSGGEKGILGII